MLEKIAKGLISISLAVVFIFTLHILNSIVISIYNVGPEAAGKLAALMTVIEVVILWCSGSVKERG